MPGFFCAWNKKKDAEAPQQIYYRTEKFFIKVYKIYVKELYFGCKEKNKENQPEQ